MARSIAKGPKPRAGHASIDKNAPKPFAPKPFKPRPGAVASDGRGPRPEGGRPSKASLALAAQNAVVPSNTVAVALVRAQKHGVAKVDARMLLLHTLGRATADTAWLIAHEDHALTAGQTTAFGDACTRRRAGEPVAYLVGHKAFYGLNLGIDARVLDPRPDTETLVDWACELLKNFGTSADVAPPTSPRVLDLGTGSGAIALALAHVCAQTCPQAQITAVDASADALTVARANAAQLGLSVAFCHGNWFDTTPPLAQRFDLIASNPPYIALGDPHLAALTHEPLAALVSGPDGLDDLRQIVATAPAHLSPGGWLLLEHGHDQADAVAALLRDQGFAAVQSRADLAGVARCTGGQWPQQ